MSEFQRTDYYSSTGDTLRAYINKVMVRMGSALVITGGIAFLFYMSLINGGFFYKILTTMYTPFMVICCVAQLAVAIMFSARLTTLDTSTCTGLFYVYAALTGVTFSVLPLAFSYVTIFQAFLFTAVMFFSCAVIGHTTDVDLTRFSGLLRGGLIALLVTTVISIFVPSLRGSLLVSYLAIGLFLALTAYDMQKIKQFYYMSDSSGTLRENLAVYGAFQLYLDFINLFLRVLQILGRRNNRN